MSVFGGDRAHQCDRVRCSDGYRHSSYGEYHGSCPVDQAQPARPALIDQAEHKRTAEAGCSRSIVLVVSLPPDICLNDDVSSPLLSLNRIDIFSWMIFCSSLFDDQTRIQTPDACALAYGPWNACGRRSRSRNLPSW